MNKPVYLGLSILQMSKTVMHEPWYNYMKSKYRYKAKLRYIDTDTFITYIKTEEIYVTLQKMLKQYLTLKIRQAII